MRIATIVASHLVSMAVARGDQCTWVNPEQAAAAASMLEANHQMIRYCQACGDTAKDKRTPIEVVSVVVASEANGHRTVVVNGHPVDLAYVFARVSRSTFVNLGYAVGCPVKDGPTTINF